MQYTFIFLGGYFLVANGWLVRYFSSARGLQSYGAKNYHYSKFLAVHRDMDEVRNSTKFSKFLVAEIWTKFEVDRAVVDG